jgi:hypothetical protein
VVGLSALTRPVVGLSGKAGIQGGGEIFGVGSLDPPRFAVAAPRRRADANWRRQSPVPYALRRRLTCAADKGLPLRPGGGPAGHR